MSIRVILQFDPEAPDIQAIPFARLLCDIQDLSLMVVILSLSEDVTRMDEILIGSIAVDPVLQKYAAFIEMRAGAFGVAEVYLQRIEKHSPLIIEYLLKLPSVLNGPFRKAFKFIYERVLYGDLQRQKRQLEVDSRRENLLRKRIDNLSAAFDLADKIQNPRLREQFLAGLEFSITPFETEHPQITSAEVHDDDSDESPV